ALQEARLEQRQRQSARHHARSKAVLLVGQVFTVLHRAPGQSGHDDAHSQREQRRRYPAILFDCEGAGDSAEKQERRQGHLPRHVVVAAGDEMDQQADEAKQAGKHPRSERPIGGGRSGVAGRLLRHADPLHPGARHISAGGGSSAKFDESRYWAAGASCASPPAAPSPPCSCCCIIICCSRSKRASTSSIGMKSTSSISNVRSEFGGTPSPVCGLIRPSAP